MALAVVGARTDEDRNAETALRETIARRTVAIVPRIGLELGSGVCLSYRGEYFVVTAAHVVENTDAHDIFFIAVPEAGITDVPDRLQFSERFLPPVDDIVVSDNPRDDLALLHLSARPKEMAHIEFPKARLGEVPDRLRKQVILHGFPGESMKMHDMDGERAGAVFPYFEFPSVARITRSQSTVLRNAKFPRQYRPTLHTVLTFPAAPSNRPDLLKDPSGLSGGGIWKGPKVEPNRLWVPTGAKLVGIQVWWFEKYGVLIATRAKRVWRLLERWAKSRGKLLEKP